MTQDEIILRSAAKARPGTAWNLTGSRLEQADDGTTRVSVPTQAELDTALPLVNADIVNALRFQAVDEVNNGTQPLIKVQRAAISLLVDELNLLRQRDNDRATDVAAATSLADLKTRWAARPSLPDRTLAQAKTAIQNKVNAGTAD